MVECTSEYPVGPRNAFVTPTYFVGAVDVRYDNPLIEPGNSGWQIVGVDIYRSYDSPDGPYHKINDFPIGALSYRDITKDQYLCEDVTQQFFSRGEDPAKEWAFKVRKIPMIKKGSQLDYAVRDEDVEVTVYNPETSLMEKVPVQKVVGSTGEVQIVSTKYYDFVTSEVKDPLLPDFSNPNNKVICCYNWGKHLITHRLLDRIYYKVVTVGINPVDNTVVSTPLDQVEPLTPLQVGGVDWVWRRGLELNRWMLEQGGETVMLFLRKWFGQRCGCYKTERGQGKADCPICFYTSWVGGFEGNCEFTIII